MDNLFKVATLAIVLISALYMHNKRNNHGRSILANRVNDDYDYVIVGGGSAGSVLASRLSEDTDKTVLLLEAGEFYDETPAIHTPIAWGSLLRSKYDWGYYTTPEAGVSLGYKNGEEYWARGKVLGGSSSINAMIYIRGFPVDFNEWETRGCTGWGYTDVLPYFLKSEDIQIPELKTSSYHASGGPMAISRGSLKSELSSMILKAGQEIGYEILSDANGKETEGFSEIQLTARNGVRESTSTAFLGGTTDRTNLDISVESYVTRVNIENKVATGVWYIKDNRKYYVRARKEVILSAGAVNSPQLLLLSGVGPKQHLNTLKIPVVVDLPVGENLQNHPALVLATKINKPLSMTFNWWSDIEYTIFGTGPKATNGFEINAFVNSEKSKLDKTTPDVQLLIGSSVFPPDLYDILNFNEPYRNDLTFGPSTHGFTTILSKARSTSRGTVRLRSTDPFDYPLIASAGVRNVTDVETMLAGIRVWERLVESKTLGELGASVDDMRLSACSDHEFRSDAYWECAIRHFSGFLIHHSGTCKMGDVNDPTAVVDPELRVKGIKGLRVADTSIFPAITSGNTNAPVIMVAEKAADMIRGKVTV